MKWRGNRESSNVEDRRSGGGIGSYGGRGIRIGGGRGLGLGTIAIALVAGWLLGVNPLTLLGILAGDPMAPAPTEQAPAQRGPIDDELGRFVSVVLADTEDVWKEIFAENGGRYQEPTLVLFRGATRTACGVGQAAMGPFYCPADRKVYIDLGFYETMRSRLGAPGDFAQAYVIAHEVGHHVQNLLGVSEKVQSARARMSQADGNELSVRTELQADCFAGVWANRAHAARQILEKGDVEEAMNAAAQIGDDALQKRSQGYVVPDSFTHGTSRQRVQWFRRGLESGDFRQCDTFNARAL
ncbi:zinc metallopeptidase [Burkholderiaceae bacterium FT117]|uniref:KPN_02809 family neutral zinc metallopeptidase n=1 Tax=Zeimonas sediminis TaxID=2944268 RepID=UPI002342CDF5|nr:neutral zinc metallopeptidase [Zeimonas sediminis]MCM5571554.1 zinc metallopeptidase [Zeimonas sediminis]